MLSDSAADPFGLRGKVAAVFGVGPGIGLETVRALAAAGCGIAAIDISRDAAAGVSDAVEHGAQPVMPFQADVTSRESVARALVQVTEQMGAPSAVVNVIGFAIPSPFDEMSDDNWDRMQSINLRQQFVVAQESLRVMARPGSYVVISSINGVVTSPYNAAYGAAKAGLISLVKSLAVEFAEKEIRVNAVAPGIIRTPRMEESLRTTGRGSAFAASVPLGRIGEPEEIGRVAAFLASPLASYVTGQALLVDGGASVKYPLVSLFSN